jgi:3-methyl-2-oxobutanoate hydroxymethyltransferase
LCFVKFVKEKHVNRRKVTILDVQDKKDRGEPITMLTAYDYPTGLLVDQAGIDIILVGDSLAMVVLGHESTVSVTMDEMLHHCRAVARGARASLLVGDMAIVDAGVPVMGHIGLTPQSVSKLGGYRVQGRDVATAKALIDDAQALEAAGAFGLLLEAIPSPVAKLITERVAIPTIGIGAGPDCDGQVLVIHDLIGLFDRFVPKFVKQYANISATMTQALAAYRKEVLEKAFPSPEHSYGMSDEALEGLLKALGEP